MADLDWIKRTVDTRGKLCPLFTRKCVGPDCAFWLHEILSSASTKAVMQDGCLFAFQYVMTHEAVLESVRTQAGIDKAVSVAADGPRKLVGAMVAARAALSGGGGGRS